MKNFAETPARSKSYALLDKYMILSYNYKTSHPFLLLLLLSAFSLTNPKIAQSFEHHRWVRPTQYGIAMIKSFSKSMHCESKHCCTDYFDENNLIVQSTNPQFLPLTETIPTNWFFVDWRVLYKFVIPVIILPVLQIKTKNEQVY